MNDLEPLDALDGCRFAVVGQDRVPGDAAEHVGVARVLPQVHAAGGGLHPAGGLLGRRRGRRFAGGRGRRRGRVTGADDFDDVAAQVALRAAVLDEVPGVAVLLYRLQQVGQGHVLGDLLYDRAVDGCPQVASAHGRPHIAEHRCGGGSVRRGRRCGRGGRTAADQLYAVVPRVVGLSVLAHRVPGISALFHGVAGEGQRGALAGPVVLRVVVAAGAGPQVAAAQDQLDRRLGGGIGAAARRRRGRRRGNGFTALGSAAQDGDEVAHDVAGHAVVPHLEERAASAPAHGGDRQQFHLGVPVQPHDAVVARARTFAHVRSAGGHHAHGAGLGRQVALPGGCRGRRRGR